ncbi:MAG: hemolysin family protein [Ardenticatenaceae bacterium]
MIITTLTILIIMALMISANALYVAGEFAVVSARKTRIIQMAEDGNRWAKILLPVLEDHHKLDNYIAASQVGITISSIVLGIYGQEQIAPLLEPLFGQWPFNALPFLEGGTGAAATSAILVLVFLTTLQVVLGELVPKSLALQYPEKVALATVLPMKLSADYLLKPLIIILNGSGFFILKLMGLGSGGGHTHVHSPEEIEILVSESHQAGLLDADERQLLHNAFRLGELKAGEVMIPRTRIIAASIDTPLHELLQLAAESAYTRILIYKENVDHIVGFVHLKELFRLFRRAQEESLHTILRQAPHVPETTSAAEVWEILREKQSYMAIVFDEYGGTAGIITQEDLIEELFGELQDEFDQEKALIARVGDGRFVLRGDMQITYLNELLNTNFSHEVANTVGGLVLERLGRVPAAGDEVVLDEIRFRVETVVGRSVREVSVTMPEGMATRLEETR